MSLYHSEQDRWEFKNLDAPFTSDDIINYTLLFITTLIDKDLPGSSNKKTCKEELKLIAQYGWIPEIEKRAEVLLQCAEIIPKKYGIDTKTLSQFKTRLQDKFIPAEVIGEFFNQSRSI